MPLSRSTERESGGGEAEQPTLHSPSGQVVEWTARRWLSGSEPFTAKLNPAYAPYGDYDQLMRLEEWYGR